MLNVNMLIIRTLFKEARRKQKIAHVISGHGISAQEKQITKLLLVLTTMFLFTTGPLALALLIHRISPNYYQVVQILLNFYTIHLTFWCRCCAHISSELR